MASIRLAGTLEDPLEDSPQGNKIRFTHMATTGETLEGFQSLVTFDATGIYDFNLNYGNVFIETFDTLSQKWVEHGVITINADTPASSIPALLGITTPATDADLLVFQSLVADAEEARYETVAAKDIAVAAKDETLERTASYEVETTEYLINTFDSSALVAGDIVKTLGYTSKGDGGAAEWVMTNDTGTPSQSPIDLVDGKLTDINGVVFELVTDGCVNVLSFGAVNSTVSTENSTGAFAAMANHCLSTGDSWVANGNFYVDEAECFTKKDGASTTLYSSNDGESTPAFLVSPNPNDLISIDVTDFNNGLPLQKGESIIPALAGYNGYYVKIVSPENYIIRNNDSSSYRYEYHVRVVDDTGRVEPELPYDWPDTVLATAIDAEKIQGNVSISNLKVVLSEGAAGSRRSLVESQRSNVTLKCEAENNTGLPALQLFKVDACGNLLLNCKADKALVDSTNYGYNLTGCMHTLIDCEQTDCRRGLDGHYSYGITVIGGSYPNGIGAHFGFNYDVSSVKNIGYSSANANPLYFAGGNIRIKDSSVTTATGDIFNVRTDMAECIGEISITGCNLTFDWTDQTGIPTGNMIFISPNTSAPDYGRDLELPKFINIKDNSVSVLGDDHAGRVFKLKLFNSSSSSNDVLCDTSITYRGNTYKDNGSVEYRYDANKKSYVSGSVLSINDEDYQDVGQVFLANAKADYVAPFTEFFHKTGLVSSMRGDYGWMTNAKIYNSDYDTATSNTSYTDQSDWVTISKSGEEHLVNAIADDSAISIDLYDNYTSVDITVSNLINSFGRFSVDGDENGATLVSMYSSGLTVIDRTELTGVTGVDGNASISVTGGKLYIENRGGASRTFKVKFNM